MKNIKKTQNSSVSSSDGKKGFPKVVFKKQSPKKNAKKQQSSPHNKLQEKIKKVVKETTNVLKQEKPMKVKDEAKFSKQKKKNSDIKDAKDSKVKAQAKVTEKNKTKSSKKANTLQKDIKSTKTIKIGDGKSNSADISKQKKPVKPKVMTKKASEKKAEIRKISKKQQPKDKASPTKIRSVKPKAVSKNVSKKKTEITKKIDKKLTTKDQVVKTKIISGKPARSSPVKAKVNKSAKKMTKTPSKIKPTLKKDTKGKKKEKEEEETKELISVEQNTICPAASVFEDGSCDPDSDIEISFKTKSDTNQNISQIDPTSDSIALGSAEYSSEFLSDCVVYGQEQEDDEQSLGSNCGNSDLDCTDSESPPDSPMSSYSTKAKRWENFVETVTSDDEESEDSYGAEPEDTLEMKNDGIQKNANFVEDESCVPDVETDSSTKMKDYENQNSEEPSGKESSTVVSHDKEYLPSEKSTLEGEEPSGKESSTVVSHDKEYLPSEKSTLEEQARKEGSLEEKSEEFDPPECEEPSGKESSTVVSDDKEYLPSEKSTLEGEEQARNEGSLEEKSEEFDPPEPVASPGEEDRKLNSPENEHSSSTSSTPEGKSLKTAPKKASPKECKFEKKITKSVPKNVCSDINKPDMIGPPCKTKPTSKKDSESNVKENEETRDLEISVEQPIDPPEKSLKIAPKKFSPKECKSGKKITKSLPKNVCSDINKPDMIGTPCKTKPTLKKDSESNVKENEETRDLETSVEQPIDLPGKSVKKAANKANIIRNESEKIIKSPPNKTSCDISKSDMTRTPCKTKPSSNKACEVSIQENEEKGTRKPEICVGLNVVYSGGESSGEDEFIMMLQKEESSLEESTSQKSSLEETTSQKSSLEGEDSYEEDGFIMVSQEKGLSPPKKSVLEDDLLISSSTSQCSRASTASLENGEQLNIQSKVRPTQYSPGPLSSKLLLKRKNRERMADEIHQKRKLYSSSTSSISSYDEANDRLRKPKKRKILETPTYTIDKIKLCRKDDDQGHNSPSPDISCMLFQDADYSPKSSQSSGGYKTPSQSSLSPLMSAKVVVERLPERSSHEASVLSPKKSTPSPNKGISLKPCVVHLTKLETLMNEQNSMTSPLCVSPQKYSKSEESQCKVSAKSVVALNQDESFSSKMLTNRSPSLPKSPSRKDHERVMDLSQSSLKETGRTYSQAHDISSIKSDLIGSNMPKLNLKTKTPIVSIEDTENKVVPVPAKKPKLTKKDLMESKKRFLNKLRIDKQNLESRESIVVQPTKDFDEHLNKKPLETEQKKSYNIPVRKVFNSNKTTPELNFKLPSKVYSHKKENIKMSDEDSGRPGTKQNSTATLKMSNDWWFVSQTPQKPNQNSVEDDQDDNESVMSLAVSLDLKRFVESRDEESNEPKTGLPERTGNPSHKRNIHFGNSLSNSNKEFQEGRYSNTTNATIANNNPKRMKTNNIEMLPSNVTKEMNSISSCNMISKGQLFRGNHAQPYSNKPRNFNDEFKLMGNPHQERTQSSSSEPSSETSPFFTHFNSDSNSYGNVTFGSPFDGYCIQFLRHSTRKEHENHHHCQLKHEVPNLLSEILHKGNCEEVIRRTSEVIKRICSNCTNPPLLFLTRIITFCVKLKQLNTISFLVKSFKESINFNAVGNDKYVEVWSHIAKTLASNLVEYDQNPAGPINTFLQSIIHDDIESNTESNIRVLYLTLQHLATMGKCPTLKLLNCVDFLGKYKVQLYPFGFIEAVLEQVIAKAKYCNNSNFVNSFIFKVHKKLLSTVEDAKYIYNENRQLTDEFFRIARDIQSTQDIYKEVLERNRISHNISPGLDSEPRCTQRENVQQRVPSAVMNMDRQPVTIQSTPQQQRSDFAGGVITTNQIKKMTPEAVFAYFKRKGIQSYLEMLNNSENALKNMLNGVTMSFIIIESEGDNPNNCYLLAQQLSDFYPAVVEDFTNKNITPARRLFIIINSLLKSYHTQEAVDWFTHFRLFEKDKSKWLVQASHEDIEMWESNICKDMETAFRNLTRFTESEAHLFSKLITHQNSLSEPVDLKRALNNFIWKAVPSAKEGGWKSISIIVSAVSRLELLKQLNLDGVEQYRILIKAISVAEGISEEEKVLTCARLMRRSLKTGDIYPSGDAWSIEGNEVTLKTSLNYEEIYALTYFKIKTFQKVLEQLKSLHFTFEKCEINPRDWRLSEFKFVDTSVEGAKERFKKACQQIGLNQRLLVIHRNKITIDRIMLLNDLEESS